MPRRAYERMLAAAESGGIDAIVTWHNDRLHRSPRELEAFIDLVERSLVRLAGAWACHVWRADAARMTGVDGDVAGRLTLALAQVEELAEENARLRGLLGLDSRQDDGHRHGWAPTLFTKSNETATMVGTASVEEKVTLLRRLFGARSDVFAIRWENATSSKSGWSPAVRGGWANRRTKKEYLPLTDEILARHLQGEVTIGIYPLLPNDTCTLLACDFDQGTWALDALAYLDACHRAEVPAALERSRSGDGAHVWVFFEGEVPASTARSVGTSLLLSLIHI